MSEAPLHLTFRDGRTSGTRMSVRGFTIWGFWGWRLRVEGLGLSVGVQCSVFSVWSKETLDLHRLDNITLMYIQYRITYSPI